MSDNPVNKNDAWVIFFRHALKANVIKNDTWLLSQATSRIK